MKKILSMIFTAMLFISVLVTGTFSLTVAADNTVVNVYDAQTLKTALTTADADIVLWNDVTYSSSAEIVCHSIDLNGYKLVYNNTMSLASDVDEFVILDSLFSNDADNTGKLTVAGGVVISQGNFIIENGEISISKGLSGEGNLKILNGNIYIYGSDGSRGTNGTDGADAEYGNYNGKSGSNGTNGRAGASGTDGINVTSLIMQDGYLYALGGTGGDGGHGGDGGDGANGKNATANSESWGNYDGGDGGNGGAGGNGGKGGAGGDGIDANTVEILGGVVVTHGAAGGEGGDGGTGGTGGKGGSRYSYRGSNGTSGSNGANGAFVGHGYGGSGIYAEEVIVYNGNLKCYGGNPGFVGGYSGGAGIHSNLTVFGGSIYAYGYDNGAGIGGASGYDGDGADIVISGGYVLAQGNGNGFDIGGSGGTPGTLEVTGGTLEFMTYGRATNVSTPIFKNCTITGEGAYQHEGTYNADGKFTVAVDDIIISPSDSVGYDTVNVTAALRISRTSNITTPKLKGYISFKLDGREFATAAITDAVAADGVITATATAEWVAVEGEHNLSAEYVSGSADMYASAGNYVETSNIPAHTHNWNDEYTVDVEPTCTESGSKSIHCSICDVQKDFTVIDANGHNYINNQCQNCQEFLPLVIFKDYDGTILSSEYYYLGDTVVTPENPTRDADNTYTYNFIGWDKEVTDCDGDKVYTAVYESVFREYTITFKNYDGKELLKQTYHYGDLVVGPSEIPKKESDKQYNYTFAGWDSALVHCDGDKVYTAVFTSEFIEYTVVFKDYNGAIISQKEYHYGDVVELPEEPSKPSDAMYTYTFDGWDKNVTAVVGDAVYTAVYMPRYIDYTVVFKNYDGTILSQKNYHYGDEVIVPTEPMRPANNIYTYTFAGWDKSVVNCAGNVTYTAVYISNYIEYNVIFKDWNGEVLSSRTYYWGDKVIAPVDPVKAADNTYTYTFAGWDKPIIDCEGNATYTATYNRSYIMYTVVFKDWDGTILSTKTYCWGDRVITPVTPVKAADNTYTYTFAGWDKTVTNCAGNATYTAMYDRKYIEYTVTFKDWNGEILSSKIYYWGNTISTPSKPTRPADNTYTYTFAGWDKSVVNCAGNATYTAQYTRNYIDYTVVFKNWDGTIISSKTYHWGDAVTAPETPTRPYEEDFIYTFSGWDKPIVNCNGNVTYTATYNKTAIVVTCIEIISKPNKLTYVEGEEFDSSGMVVVAYYNNNTDEIIAGYTISGYNSTPGEKIVTVSYEGQKATFSVVVLCGQFYDNTCDTTCNECGAVREITHTYSNDCDADCNVCGFERIPSAHVYDNTCDTTCNECNAVRSITHTYSNNCDANCNICGATRTPSGHVYDHIYDAECNVCGAIRQATPLEWKITVVQTGVYTLKPNSKYIGSFSIDRIAVFDKNGNEVIYNITKGGFPLVKEQEYTVKFKNDCSDEIIGEITWTKIKKADTIFPDTKASAWYNDAVTYAVGAGIMSGYQNGNFGTSDSIQRQDFLVMLARLEGVDLTAYGAKKSAFPDVPENSYFEAAVNWGSEKGIVTGYDNGKFGVGDKVTREQLVTFLYRYANYKGIDTTCTTSQKNTVRNKYSDFKHVSVFAQDAIFWAVTNGVISGKTSTTIVPQGNAQRCEVAKIMYNIYLNDVF